MAGDKLVIQDRQGRRLHLGLGQKVGRSSLQASPIVDPGCAFGSLGLRLQRGMAKPQCSEVSSKAEVLPLGQSFQGLAEIHIPLVE